VESPRLASGNTHLGVYLRPVEAVAALLSLAVLLLSVLGAGYVWARHRYPEIRAALSTPLFSWLDYCYRAFMRG
jgi:hypothetical protein